MRRRIIQKRLGLLAGCLLTAGAWMVAVAIAIVHHGAVDHAASGDIIIVLGAAVSRGEPTPAFAARIQHGIDLWRRGMAPVIFFTGGLTHGGTETESEVARGVALTAGVPDSAILIETVSTNTWENLSEAARLMDLRGYRRAIIVSDPYHLLRAGMMADDAGIAEVLTSPSHRSPTPWRVLVTEAGYCHVHWLKRLLGER